MMGKGLVWAVAALFAAWGAGSLAGAQVPEDGVLASEVSLTVTPSNAPAQPSGAFLQMPVEVAYTVTEAVPESQVTEARLTVVAAPPWAIVTVSPDTVVFPLGFPAPCGCERTQTVEAVLIVSAKPEAPAFQQEPVTLRVEAMANGAYAGSEAETEVPIIAGFLSELRVTISPSRLQVATTGDHEVAVTVRNDGNARTLVTFEPDGDAEADASGAVASFPPSPLVLDPGTEGTGTWVLRIASGAGTGQASLLVKGAYHLDPSLAGDTQQVSIAFESPRSDVPQEAGIAPAPGPGAGLLMLALASAAGVMAARQRRRDPHGGER